MSVRVISMRCLLKTVIVVGVFVGLAMHDYQYLHMSSTRYYSISSANHSLKLVQDDRAQRSRSSEKLSSPADTGSVTENPANGLHNFTADHHNLSVTLFDTAGSRNSFLKPADTRNCVDQALNEVDLPICVNDLERCMTGKSVLQVNIHHK